MFVSAVAVDHVRKVERHVCRALRRRNHVQFFASLHNELPLAPIPYEIGLDEIRSVVVLIAADNFFRFLLGLKVICREDARPGGISSRPDHLSRIREVLVSKHVTRVGLGITAGGNTVSKTCQEVPVFEVQNASPNIEPVRVNVDEARDNRVSPNVKYFGPCGYSDRAACANGLNPIVLDDDVGGTQYFVAAHSDYFCSS